MTHKKPPCEQYGDVLGDGLIGADDVVALREHVYNIRKLTPEQFHRADIKGEGVLNTGTVILLQNFLKMDGITFPVCSNSTPTPSSTPTPLTSYGSIHASSNVLADVSLDNSTTTHKTPYIFFNVSIGNHILTFSRTGYLTLKKSITAKSNTLVTYYAALIKSQTPDPCPYPTASFYETLLSQTDTTRTYNLQARSIVKDVDQRIVKYEWYIDDVFRGTGQDLQIVVDYKAHYITLRATNYCGKRATGRKPIYAQATPTPTPTPFATPTPYTAPTPDPCPYPTASFYETLLSQTDTTRTYNLQARTIVKNIDQQIVKYEWYVDNVLKGTNQNLQIVVDYKLHAILLKVTNNCGKIGTGRKPIYAQAKPTPHITPTPRPYATPTPTPRPDTQTTPTPKPSVSSYSTWVHSKGGTHNLNRNLPAFLEIVDAYMGWKNVGFKVTLSNLLSTLDSYIDL